MNAMSKGKGPVSARYAEGGPPITTKSRFLKTPDTFRTDRQRIDYDKKSKGGEMSKLEGGKSLTPVKPHK
jgi:hypothetical protein